MLSKRPQRASRKRHVLSEAQPQPAGGREAPEIQRVAGVYAGFWKRFAALILDYLILLATSVFIGAVIGLLFGSPEGSNELADNLGGLAGILVWWLYYGLMESSRRQATLGKMALGIKVVDLRGERVSFLRATARHFAKLLSGVLLLVGYMMAGFTSRKQALHDVVASCLVVNRGAPAELVRQGIRAVTMPAWAAVLVVLGALLVPLLVFAAIAIPAYQDFVIRARAASAFAVGRAATAAVDDFYAGTGRLPANLKEAGLSPAGTPHILSFDPGSGTVRVLLTEPPMAGKSIFFQPRRESDQRLAWVCGSADIKPAHLPHHCRG
jgi:uncharacterized RDD family membrane protein YckC